MTTALTRQHLKADHAALQALIDQTTDADFLTRRSLMARQSEIANLLNTPEPDEHHSAILDLFFGGRPVFGSQGVESEFAGSAIAKLQDLVAKLHAYETSGLGQRGVVPNRRASTLHITGIVRGSFGFRLQEVQQQGQIIDTALKTAVDRASTLLISLGTQDEVAFSESIDNVDQRVLTTAREFFTLIRDNGATFRLTTTNADASFGTDVITRALERATSTSVEDTDEVLRGSLAGVLPEGHVFEFVSDTLGTIRGRVDRALPITTLMAFNREMLLVPATATFKVRRVRHNGEVVRETFALTGIERLDLLPPPTVLVER